MANKYTNDEYKLLIDIFKEDVNFYIGPVRFAYHEYIRDLVYTNIIYNQKTKKNIKKFDNVLYDLMYKTKYEDLPTEINNTHFGAKQVVNWRLKIGK